MILSRVIEHVKAQHWTAVVLDFAIVVLGVVIGIQVSNWNAAQADARRGAAFTEQLRADLYLEAWGFARLVEYNRDVLAAAEAAVAALEGDAELSDEAMLIDAYVATQYINHYRSSATYEELKSTGAMGLIADKALRELAANVFTTPVFTDIQEEGVQSAYRARFRRILPNVVQDALAASCGDRVAARGDFEQIRDMIGYPCETGLDPAVIAEAAGVLRSDATLREELRRRISDLKTRLADLTVNNIGVRDGLRAVSGEDL